MPHLVGTASETRADARTSLTPVIVCHCRNVNERAVRAAIENGAVTVAEIGERCGAGLDCAGCHPELERLLSERADAVRGPLAAFRSWRQG